MKGYTGLAKCTLGLSWTFTIFALLSCIAGLYRRVVQPLRTSAADILVMVSFVLGTVLVAQSTWAIIDEGQGEHQWLVSDSKLSRAAKVHNTRHRS